jgi:hypothetical protein
MTAAPRWPASASAPDLPELALRRVRRSWGWGPKPRPPAMASSIPIRRTTGRGARRAEHHSFPLMQQVPPPRDHAASSLAARSAVVGMHQARRTGEAFHSEARGARCRRRVAPLDAPCRCGRTVAGRDPPRSARRSMPRRGERRQDQEAGQEARAVPASVLRVLHVFPAGRQAAAGNKHAGKLPYRERT